MARGCSTLQSYAIREAVFWLLEVLLFLVHIKVVTLTVLILEFLY